MAAKKGHKKAGGRQKGTPNKTTQDLRSWISQLLDDNRKQVIDDLKKLEPHQRVAVFEKLASYVIPKMQSIDATVQIAEEYNQLERLLQTAPDEAVERIAEKVMELSNENKQKNEK